MEEFEPVLVRNVRHSDLERLCKSVKTYAGCYVLKEPSGEADDGLDAHCWFPSRDDSVLFQLQWASPGDA
ncbi:hypothetical protein SM0020_05240 [Sinorhizobium meliloti CCNWSX0020]|uniref:Uncharacterized protein n=1 Tax=Sinorhizobium meliloti CCNWSX0020 TaxID=1107881 RepID=H0FV52_RHIML|nr:hypothetical protein SM0020_05240 [Sinorhizobium meliloti CCNWSX0020]PII39062.1 hypothetical protein T190_11285 [Sinorhizobium meliloti CCBAU 01290]RVG58957.1 hypothetical protein CN220_33775 [Sinorhizobium meliloti]